MAAPPATGLAQEKPQVEVDPNSPTGVEYAIPLLEGRREGGSRERRDGSAERFGAGIRPVRGGSGPGEGAGTDGSEGGGSPAGGRDATSGDGRAGSIADVGSAGAAAPNAAAIKAAEATGEGAFATRLTLSFLGLVLVIGALAAYVARRTRRQG